MPSAVSVGAVYESNTNTSGAWCLNSACSVTCTDSPAPDRVTCFSNSASYLTIPAPGVDIAAAGITMDGTSQATPHITGAIAALRGQGAFQCETVDQTVSRMTSTGVSDLGTRNGVTTPRIDLLAAVGGSSPISYSISGTITVSETTTPLSGVTV